jgi:hypothetical protein
VRFSHLGAALFILMINTMVVLIWWASWKLGASIDMQLYIVIGMGFAVAPLGTVPAVPTVPERHPCHFD